MPVAIKIKRFETVGDVPNTSELVDGEIAVNVADKKIYVRDGSSIVTISGADFSAVGEDIIPDGNGTRNLGSASKRFADLFLSGDTINLGGATISSDGTGTVSVSANGVTLPAESRDEDGNIKRLLSFNIESIFLQTTKYGSIIKNIDTNIYENILSNFKIYKLLIKRKFVTKTKIKNTIRTCKRM